MKVTVTAPGVPMAGGTINVTLAGETWSGQLVNGTVTVKLPKQAKPGKKKLLVEYFPSSGNSGATQTVTVKVTRR